MAMSSRNRGSILAETVLVMPLLLLLIFGVIQFALIWTAKQMTAYAAFCATRAIMVVPPAEQQKYARDAAKVALSWMSLADGGAGSRVSIPGWGAVPGSGTIETRIQRDDGDNAVKILEDGTDDSNPVAAVRVTFRFPLLIPGMVVNKIIGNSKRAQILSSSDFYGNLSVAANNSNLISGWPYIELTETCVLPMPYSTANFPTGGFNGTDIYGGSL
jgi:Flp pilus assembly protein TadG